MTISKNKQKIQELLTRGVAEIINSDHLKKRLLKGDKLRLKLGIDPTGPNLHIGHGIVLRKLRAFQNLGHKVIIIVGDFTAQIGDPSGHDKMREPLAQSQIKKNLVTFKKQALMILDPKHTEFAYQTKWFDKMSLQEFSQIAGKFSVWRVLERDLYAKRKQLGEELSELELLYPIFQAYDSVAIKSDVEFGGTDQTFNLLQGRKVQELYKQPPQDIFTVQLLIGIDGRKMSKTYNNAINLLDSPEEKYGKLMSMRDNLLNQYFTLCTDLPLSEIKEIVKGNPRDAKMRLAREIISIYHSKADAIKAELSFIKTFQKHEAPDKVKTKKIQSKEIRIIDLLVESNLVTSKNEARRAIQQGGVKADGELITDISKKIELSKKGVLIQKGKRHFIKAVA